MFCGHDVAIIVVDDLITKFRIVHFYWNKRISVKYSKAGRGRGGADFCSRNIKLCHLKSSLYLHYADQWLFYSLGQYYDSQLGV